MVAWSWELANRPTELINCLVRHLDEYLDDSPSVDDWVAWARFFEEFSEEVDLGSADELKDRVLAFAENEKDEIISDPDIEEREWGAHQLSELGDAWEVDLSDLVTELEEAAAGHEVDYDDDWRGGGLGRPRDATPIGGIEEMFDSLRHSEE